ncbi:hypothetical protein K450DRAFT_255136 [Umbelopsis ramanniana AG]|uniref:Rap-GAP domain-containing protein n=1 Tax=Umbelopsis ramanniana AG TaxID=1314678 RepID=A0AAD5E4X1_UMBRA|nr:uncharacterized protein K450DRAFT_255136 [Umbelopsis ramanniana AG]KAI8576819.1 hypothetical protein K450DRAFT_255136 [Umbelopsis ramanniana AG]
MIIPAKGFWIEGTNKYTDLPKSISTTPDETLPDYDACELEHYDHKATWFRTYFAGQDYLTLCGSSVDNPVLITILEEMPNASLKELDSEEDDSPSDQDTQYRVIVRKTTPPDSRTLVSSAHLKVGSSAASTASASSVYNDLTSIWPSIVSLVDASIDTSVLQVVHSKTLQSSGVEQNIIRLDELGVHNRYKFGVLVVKDGQTKEEDWFANSETPDGLERFLNIVSKRVELQGYEGWSAGLDTRSGDSGTHTYISMRDDATLAFHVSTLIPSRPVDKQHIQRKRHIGNDIVCVIFVDGRQPFNPAAIKSQFLHVFIIVHEELVDDRPVWRVEVVANENVGKFGPALPPNGLFYNSDQLASFIHVKLINAENAALKSPKFAAPNARAREGILLNHIQRIIGLVPAAKKRHTKSPSTLSDPSVNSQRAYDSVVGLEFNLPDKTAKVRPNALPGMSRRRSTHEAGGLRVKPWISRGKKGKGYGRDQGTHRRSRSELDLPVAVEQSVHDVTLLDASEQGDRDGIRSRAQTLFASLQQWGGRWNASPYRPHADEQELDGRSPSENV